MTWPATRQTSAATPRACWPLARHHQVIAANSAPSAIRSQTESSTAPNGVLYPRARAIAPSIMSNSTKTVASSAPRNSWPRGMNHDRRGRGADGAGDRDRVRGDAAGDQPAPDRGGDPADVRRAKRLSIDSCSVPGGGLSRVARR